MFLKTTLFSIVLLFSLQISAQVAGADDKYNKLFDLYVVDKFEDCMYKAAKMTDDDEYKKDPEPYLYLSMCLFNIYKDIDNYDSEKYSKPLDEALKEAANAVKKDKEGRIIPQNIEFINELKVECLKKADEYYDQQSFSKAASYYKKILKLNDEDENMVYMLGVAQVLGKNLGEGSKSIQSAMQMLEAKYKNPSYEGDETSMKHLVKAFIDYSNYLKADNQLDSAKKTMAHAKRFLADNAEIKAAMQSLAN